jgi:hypothetical protein
MKPTDKPELSDDWWDEVRHDELTQLARVGALASLEPERESMGDLRISDSEIDVPDFLK